MGRVRSRLPSSRRYALPSLFARVQRSCVYPDKPRARQALLLKLNAGAAKLVAAQMISLADSDGSGEVSRDELKKVMTSALSGKGLPAGGQTLEKGFDLWLEHTFIPAALAAVKRKKLKAAVK